LEAFQAKIFKSLEEAFKKARTELEQSDSKDRMKQLQDGARKFQIPLSQIERLEQAIALISDGIMSPPMYLLDKDLKSDDVSVEPYLLEILTHLDLEEHEWKEILNEEKDTLLEEKDTLLEKHVKEAFPDDNLTDAEHGTKKIVKEIRQTLKL
jgi:TPP-dependent indolepyruvate ferredoxin oxidoreductase alpha subunit